jgi:hypothetical protein
LFSPLLIIDLHDYRPRDGISGQKWRPKHASRGEPAVNMLRSAQVDSSRRVCGSRPSRRPFQAPAPAARSYPFLASFSPSISRLKQAEMIRLLIRSSALLLQARLIQQPQAGLQKQCILIHHNDPRQACQYILTNYLVQYHINHVFCTIILVFLYKESRYAQENRICGCHTG